MSESYSGGRRHRRVADAFYAHRGQPAPQEIFHERPQTVANFNGAKPIINPDDAAMLLIDHQSGLFQTVTDMPMPELRAHATALAKMATLAGLPVITTASVPQGPNGPLIPEIHQFAPHAQVRGAPRRDQRLGQPGFRRRGEGHRPQAADHRRHHHQRLHGLPEHRRDADGYQVFAVVDASGTYSKMAQEITLARIVQAGVVPMDTAAVASELQKSSCRSRPAPARTRPRA